MGSRKRDIDGKARVRKVTVVGVDEAGRGPWAGPVAAGACAFLAAPGDRDIAALRRDLRDSKALSAKARENLDARIRALAAEGKIAFGVGTASAAEIDRANIRQATRIAMGRALAELEKSAPGVSREADVVIDGKDAFAFPGFPATRALVKADSKVPEAMAAAILAKVWRDAEMARLDAEHPGYGFARHAGYGTAAHAAALKNLGPCPAHRKTFRPVAELLPAA